MDFNRFYDSVSDKEIKIYVSDKEENLEAQILMKPGYDYIKTGSGIDLYDVNENMVRLPLNGKYNIDEEGFRCEAEEKIFLFSVL